MNVLITPQNLKKEMHKTCTLDFLDALTNITHARVYIFGGFVRDILLHKKPKDIDIRVLLHKNWDEREALVTQCLKKTGKILDTIRFDRAGFTVYRFTPKNSTQSVDITVAPTIVQARSDFTLNDIFVNMVTGEIIDRRGGLDDLKKRVLKTVVKPSQQFRQEPWIPLRLIKAACQFDLTVPSDIITTMRRMSAVIQHPLSYIADNPTDLWSEVLQGNLFRGLTYDPARYYDLYTTSGLLQELLSFISQRLHIPLQKKQLPTPKKYSKNFEKNISQFIRYLADHFEYENKHWLFNQITHLFALDRKKQFGELPIDHKKILYK